MRDHADKSLNLWRISGWQPSAAGNRTKSTVSSKVWRPRPLLIRPLTRSLAFYPIYGCKVRPVKSHVSANDFGPSGKVVLLICTSKGETRQQITVTTHVLIVFQSKKILSHFILVSSTLWNWKAFATRDSINLPSTFNLARQSAFVSPSNGMSYSKVQL